MNEKTLKFDNIKTNKKEFHKSKQVIDLDSVITDKIVHSLICLTNLDIVENVINTLSVIKKIKLSDHFVLSYLK